MAPTVVFFHTAGDSSTTDEGAPAPSPFDSIPATFWWTIVTLMTVGYGDVSPITVTGKCIAAVTMIFGKIVATPSLK